MKTSFRPKSLALMACTLVSIGVSTQASAADTCDQVLVQQTSSWKVDRRAYLSWVHLIDESNYEQAKTDAKAGADTAYGFFDGDYHRFKEKIRTYSEENRLNQSESFAREEYKSFLSQAQVEAWTKCKLRQRQIAVTYQNVDKNGATIVLEWDRAGGMGPLKSISAVFDSGTPPEALTHLATLNGTRAFAVRRGAKAGAIRGVISGKAGADNEDFSAPIFVAPYQAPEPPQPAKDWWQRNHSLPIKVTMYFAQVGPRCYRINVTGEPVPGVELPDKCELRRDGPAGANLGQTQEITIDWDLDAMRWVGSPFNLTDDQLSFEVSCRYSQGAEYSAKRGQKCGNEAGEPLLTWISMKLTGSLANKFKLSYSCVGENTVGPVVAGVRCAPTGWRGIGMVNIEIDTDPR